MTRFLALCCAFLALTSATSAAPVTIKWHGQSFFEIKSSKGTIIVIDPHNIEAYGRKEVKADLVLVSHFHIDHTAPQPIANINKAKILFGLKNAKGVSGNRK